MTETDPMSAGGEPPAPMMPAPTSRKPFSVGGLIGGLALSILVGGVANIVFGLCAMSVDNAVLAFGIGMIPGSFFVLMSLMASRNGFAQGLLVGGCVVGLIGGACGASMVGASFH